MFVEPEPEYHGSACGHSYVVMYSGIGNINGVLSSKMATGPAGRKWGTLYTSYRLICMYAAAERKFLRGLVDFDFAPARSEFIRYSH